MKKLVYSLAVLFSVALVSCGGNKAADGDSAADSANVEVVEVSESVSETVAPAADSAATPAADSAAADSAK